VTETADGPLAGVTVIELGQLIAGPFCGQLLGDLGATVIKVEDPTAGDPMREWGHRGDDGRTLHWSIIGRNKRSVACDLRTVEGQDVVRRLAAEADVLIENFRPGTLERWGLGYEDLSAINPRLVLVRISGYGQDGPYAARAGYGSIGEAMGGLRNLLGEPDRAPSRAGVSIGDSLAGTFAALGALAALNERHSSGVGQIIDCAIFEAVLAMTESLISDYAHSAFIRERTGAVLPGVAPSNAYETADGLTALVAANQDTVFRRLAQAMGRPDLAEDDRFATHDSRGVNQVELDDLIAEWTAQLSWAQLEQSCVVNGVPVGLVYRAPEMLEDPHFAARNSIVEVDAYGGPLPMQNAFPKLSRTPSRVRWAGEPLGESTQLVLEAAGFSRGEIDRLRSEGIVR